MNKPNNGTKNGTNNGTNDGKNYLQITSFEVLRTKMFENGGVTFDIDVNGIKIYGCRVVETDKGDFIGLPQRKGSDGKYYSIVYFKISPEHERLILQEVERKINEY